MQWEIACDPNNKARGTLQSSQIATLAVMEIYTENTCL